MPPAPPAIRPDPADLSPHDHAEDLTWPEVRESAYRRGYHQALVAASEAMDAGVLGAATLRGWLADVSRWRHRLGSHKRSRSFVRRPPITPSERAEFPHRWPDGSYHREPAP